MGNTLCGIVPTDLVCHHEEQIQSILKMWFRKLEKKMMKMIGK